MKVLFIIVFISVLGTCHLEGISSSIPDQLVQCYRKTYRDGLSKPPLNTRLLIELIRTFEFRENDALNLRMFTTSLMHSVRYDGIILTPGVAETEFGIPFRATGKPFYKFKLLVDYMISGKPQLIPEESINTNELCLLHELLSSTIQVYPPNANGFYCPEKRSLRYPWNVNREQYSSGECEVEGGVVSSRWGVISPGHLVAGVAAALQETSLNMQELLMIMQKEDKENRSDTQYTGAIDNIWIATIAGDLGEVALQQAFDTPQIAIPGMWDNILFPRIYYLQEKYHDMTVAELLGAIDGAIFASKVQDWISVLSRTRLSQLLDMYYSKRGIAYDKSYRACDRMIHFEKLLKENNLTEQTYISANLLKQIGTPSAIYSVPALLPYSRVVAKEFTKVAEATILQHDNCNLEIYDIQPMEILIMFDESWSELEAEIFLGVFSEAVDMGIYGSSIGLIDARSGLWLTNITDSLIKLYEDIHSTENEWQLPLRLSNGFAAVSKYLQNRTWGKCQGISRVPRATILLVLSTTAVLSENDVRLAKSELNTLKREYPETVVVYVSSMHNSESYLQLTQGNANDVVIKTTESSHHIIPQIMKILATIPNRIIDFYCNNTATYMEDYVTPEVSKIYEIHTEYIQRVDFFVKFKGYDYGEASICAYDSKKPSNKECKGLVGNEEISFKPRKYCLDQYSCSIQFSMTATKSQFKCSEFDCRYPDQMRIEITSTWTKRSGSTTISYSIYTVVVVLLGICLSFHEY